MEYIRDMTRILIGELDLAEEMVKHSADIAYGYWFAGRARSMVTQIEDDFKYFCEVTDIRKKAIDDKIAETVYNTMTERIANIRKSVLP